MSNKLRILLLSPYLPSKDGGGCARKVYEYLELMHHRGHDIYLLSFCSNSDRKKIGEARPYCKEMHLENIRDYYRYPLRSISITEKMGLLCRDGRVDILQCENAYMSRYLPPGIKMASVLTEHEVLSVSFYERAKLQDSWGRKLILYLRAIKKFWQEKNWYMKFNKVIVFSQHDKEVIDKLYNTGQTEVIPLGIDLRDYPPPPPEQRIYDIAFVGNFSHSSNADAALYFCREILPLIKNRAPDVSVVLAGANPPASIKKLAQSNKNILVTGYVEDIRPWYYKSRIFIAPLRYGTGMRVKILEALAAGTPVISTPVGARGISYKEVIRIADNRRDFANAVVELLKSRNGGEELARKGRDAVEKYYSWELLLNQYENIYYSLLT